MSDEKNVYVVGGGVILTTTTMFTFYVYLISFNLTRQRDLSTWANLLLLVLLKFGTQMHLRYAT